MQLLEVEVALANGTLAVVTSSSHPHLFKALQVQPSDDGYKSQA